MFAESKDKKGCAGAGLLFERVRKGADSLRGGEKFRPDQRVAFRVFFRRQRGGLNLRLLREFLKALNLRGIKISVRLRGLQNKKRILARRAAPRCQGVEDCARRPVPFQAARWPGKAVAAAGNALRSSGDF